MGIYPWGQECFTWRQFSLFCLTICWRFSWFSNLLVVFRFKEDVLDRLDFNVLLFLKDDGRVELWMHTAGPANQKDSICLETLFQVEFLSFQKFPPPFISDTTLLPAPVWLLLSRVLRYWLWLENGEMLWSPELSWNVKS